MTLHISSPFIFDMSRVLRGQVDNRVKHMAPGVRLENNLYAPFRLIICFLFIPHAQHEILNSLSHVGFGIEGVVTTQKYPGNSSKLFNRFLLD